MVQKIYFLGFFLREASRMRTAMQSHNLKVTTYNSFFRALQIKKQAVGWVARPLDPDAVFPKKNELVEFCGLLSSARGLAHGAALEPHVAYALHCYSILHASDLMFFGLHCARPRA